MLSSLTSIVAYLQISSTEVPDSSWIHDCNDSYRGLVVVSDEPFVVNEDGTIIITNAFDAETQGFIPEIRLNGTRWSCASMKFNLQDILPFGFPVPEE